jgi:acyl-CoA dehydrogenase
MLGDRGDAFVVAQVRLGGGRLHHAMRTLAEATRCFDTTCERVLSRSTKGEQLARKQMVQEKIADSWIQLRQFRLLVLEAAWLVDQGKSWKDVRLHVSAIKAAMPTVLHDIAERALHLHGSLGLSTEAPFSDAVIASFYVGLADGPTEVHKMVVAKEVLRAFQPISAMFPDYLRAARKERALARYGDVIARNDTRASDTSLRAIDGAAA